MSRPTYYRRHPEPEEDELLFDYDRDFRDSPEVDDEAPHITESLLAICGRLVENYSVHQCIEDSEAALHLAEEENDDDAIDYFQHMRHHLHYIRAQQNIMTYPFPWALQVLIRGPEDEFARRARSLQNRGTRRGLHRLGLDRWRGGQPRRR